jgi:hypothetical protein
MLTQYLCELGLLHCVVYGGLAASLSQVWDQANKLVGIVRVPLSHCHLPTAPGGTGASGSELPAVVCEGRSDVWNLLEGRAEGSVEVLGVVQVMQLLGFFPVRTGVLRGKLPQHMQAPGMLPWAG